MKYKSTILLILICAIVSPLLYKSIGQNAVIKVQESDMQQDVSTKLKSHSVDPKDNFRSEAQLANVDSFSETSNKQAINHSLKLDTRDADVNIESLADLTLHFDKTPISEINFDQVVKLVNFSDLSFDYIRKKYLSTEDPKKLSFLINVLNTTTNPARDNFAIEQTLSPELDRRRLAYHWLNNHQNQNSVNEDLVNDTLLNATYHESDNEALSQLVSFIALSSFDPSSTIRKRAILRLNELAFHPDDIVSSKAITKISKSEITQNTLNILQLNLQDSSENRQYAALKGLNNFEHLSDDILISLNTILHSSDLPQKHRALAARVIVAFENRMNAHESL